MTKRPKNPAAFTPATKTSARSEEDRLSIPLEPEEALRALLKVAPDSEPADAQDDAGETGAGSDAASAHRDQCDDCGGVGWRWQAPAVTSPPQLPEWQSCRRCDRTGIAAWTKLTKRQPKPTQPPSA